MAAVIRNWFRLRSANGRSNQVWVIAAWVGCVLFFGSFIGWTIRVAAFSNEVGLAVVVSFLACCLAMGYRWIRLPLAHSDWKRRHWVDFALPGVVLLIAASLFVAANTFTVFVVMSLMLGVETASWSWALQFGKRKAKKSTAEKTQSPPDRSPASFETESGNVLFTMVRLVEDDEEIIRGTARADFVADQRKQTIHLSFCPPLAKLPEFHCETIEGPEARIKVADLQTFGVRLEATLIETPAEAESVVVEYYAA